MALRKITPCDCSGICPYNSESGGSCEYWCGEVEPQDYPEAGECGVDKEPASEADLNFGIDTTEKEQDHSKDTK